VVQPEHAQDLIDFFQPLNPYGVAIQLLKIDPGNVLFYGISSKRYALYKFENGVLTFLEGERSFKLHGLGISPIRFPNHKQIGSLRFGAIFLCFITGRYHRSI
jgi:hypothetical protein